MIRPGLNFLREIHGEIHEGVADNRKGKIMSEITVCRWPSLISYLLWARYEPKLLAE